MKKFIDIDSSADSSNNRLFDTLARAPIRQRRINAFEKQQGMKEADVKREQEIRQIQMMLDQWHKMQMDIEISKEVA